MKKKFTKKDLMTGDVVEFNNGNRSLVLLGAPGGDKLAGDGKENREWCPINYLTDDMAMPDSGNKIVKVLRPLTNHTGASIDNTGDHETIWERHPEKTYEIDGVEYSESTLKSLIKKATE